MKNLKDKLINENAIPGIVKRINDIINDNGAHDLDLIIYDLLDGISNNGEDELVVDMIKSWLGEINK